MTNQEMVESLKAIEAELSTKITNPNVNTNEKLARDGVRTAISALNIIIEGENNV